MPVRDLSHDELIRIYGSFLPRIPADAAQVFAGYPGRWWIAGGWAIEAFTGIGSRGRSCRVAPPRPGRPTVVARGSRSNSSRPRLAGGSVNVNVH